MAYNASQDSENGKHQDDDSNSSKPCLSMVEDPNQTRKRKKSHEEEPPKKRVRGAEESPNKKTASNDNFIIISSKSGSTVAENSRLSSSYKSPTPKWNIDFDVISSTSSSSAVKEMHDMPFLVKTNRDEFKANYIELFKIGEGGFGAVYAGYHKADATPVAIKHIAKERVNYKRVVHNGKMYTVVEEVELMVKAAGGAQPCRSAAIAVLDCFDLEEEFIFIMERPVPSVDLYDYRKAQGGYLKEDKAKMVLRQVVDAAIEIHSNGVFHRDIKLENILLECGSDVPRARVIDFGCGCLVRNDSYRYFSGTRPFAPPEWFLMNEYNAGPTTVWQLGALLYNLLDHNDTFSTEDYLYEGIELNTSLSNDCLNFLHLCLAEDPEKRATLDMLRLHPWLR
ncbi:serine/threonine-protein kinase pim-2-like [Mugil cephalus]|uniref:serine/threonine-protein kinase pim-2-like n=1 Tax=Mugil cephalus TaxID=48193 RepID=UPI001FB57617|nr:serine/threonine-protein kinase pim-2-like [Mugil cephalus]